VGLPETPRNRRLFDRIARTCRSCRDP
jgi:hypothetical protein